MGVFGKMSGIDCRRFLRSPHPLPLLLIFRTPSHAVPFPLRKFSETPAMWAIRDVCRCLHSEDALDVFFENIIYCTVIAIAIYFTRLHVFHCVVSSLFFLAVEVLPLWVVHD